MANSPGISVATVTVEHGLQAPSQYRTRSMLGLTLRRLARSYSALWGLCMICGLLVIAASADFISKASARPCSRVWRCCARPEPPGLTA